MMTLFDKHAPPEATLPPITLGEKITPRDYQQEALDGFFQAYAEGSRHMMARLATGCGKTLTAALIAERWLAKGPRHRVMVMAYESILVDQFADEMREFLPHIQTRVEMANEAIIHMPQIVVASRQSLYIDKSGRSRLFKFPNKDLNWLVVCDEAHGYKASMTSFTHIVQWFEENPANVFLGLTATPQRGDGVSLKRLFGTVIAELRLSKAINEGWLVPFKQKFIRVDGVDFRALKTVAGDWSDGELDNILSEQEQLTSMAIPLLEQTEGLRTLVFTPGVSCAQKLAQVINAEIKVRGLPHGKAESMHGGTPRDERQAIIEQHQSGQIQYLVVCGLCRAGYNDPGIEAVAVFRPTKSKVLAEQMKGRGVRTLRGTLTPGMTKEERLEAIANSEKPHCLIIDMVGVSGMSEVASTAHLLAEGEDDEIVARANQNMIDAEEDAEDSETVEQAIAKAKAEIEEEREAARLAAEEAKRRQREEFERRAKLAAEVRYEAREVSGFRGFGAAHSTSANAPTAKQIAALKRHGWSAQDAGQLTKRQASAILGRLFGDKDAVSNRPVTDGPPTETQTRLLQRRGLPIPKTYGEAANIITSLDWKPLNN